MGRRTALVKVQKPYPASRRSPTLVRSDSNTLSTQKSGVGIGVGMKVWEKETLILAYSYIPLPDVYASSVTVEYHLLCTYPFP
jgi:hypothetical protein